MKMDIAKEWSEEPPFYLQCSLLQPWVLAIRMGSKTLGFREFICGNGTACSFEEFKFG